MKGIDVYQGESKNGVSSTLKTIPEKAYKESDFVIVKSTQGISYSHTAFFHNMIKRAIADGKLIGAYHYAAGHDAVKEADYFLSVVKPYIGKILLCLDWESYQNKAWGSKTWAKKFVDRVKEKTGITCILYTGLDGCNQCKNLVGITPLWFAGYPRPMKKGWTIPKFPYNLGKWGAYSIWQYTSSGEVIDRNTTPWTEKQWKKYAGDNTPVVPKPYSGALPAFEKRDYYKKWDGIITLRNYKTQIERVQKCLNWAIGANLTVDGKYGKKTEDAVRKFQTKYNFTDVNGCWGKLCNAKMKTLKR